MNEAALDRFIEKEYNEDVLLTKNGCQKDIDEIIYSRYIRMMEGDIEYKKMLNSSDPYVTEALRLIGSGKTTLALLSEE